MEIFFCMCMFVRACVRACVRAAGQRPVSPARSPAAAMPRAAIVYSPHSRDGAGRLALGGTRPAPHSLPPQRAQRDSEGGGTGRRGRAAVRGGRRDVRCADRISGIAAAAARPHPSRRPSARRAGSGGRERNAHTRAHTHTRTHSF